MPSSNGSGKRESEHNWRSRKLWFSVFSIVTLYWALLQAQESEVFRPMYETFVGGVVAITGLLLAGNVVAKWTPGTKTKKKDDEESA